jgi:hypothetical protein
MPKIDRKPICTNQINARMKVDQYCNGLNPVKEEKERVFGTLGISIVFIIMAGGICKFVQIATPYIEKLISNPIDIKIFGL